MTPKYKSKKDKAEQKKRELEEDLDYLRQVDEPEHRGGGRKFIKDYEDEQSKLRRDVSNVAKNYLEGTQNTTYRLRLSTYGARKLEELGIPDDWEHYCVATDESGINIFGKKYKTQNGVLVVLRSPKGNVYVRGISMTYNPEYDVNAIDVLIIQAENTVDSEKGILLSDNKDTASTLKKTKSGIYVP